MSLPNKSCDIDIWPTTLLKACLDTLLYPITNIVNASLCSGLFPDDFKQAQVNALLKKSSLPIESLNSHIPFLNLSFISKVLGNVAVSRLRFCCMSNVLQPAYKQFYSTETVLLKVRNDVTLNMDNGKAYLA